MDLKILLRLSLRNLLRHKTKNMLVILMIMTDCTLFFIAASLEWNIRDNWRHFLSDTILGDYYITSITGIGDDYRFFKDVIAYLDKKQGPIYMPDKNRREVL
jgi:hypothetical protein